MDEDRLAEIEARANAATEWTFDECDLRLDGSDGSTFALQGAMLGQTLVTLGDTYEGCNEDWTFLAHARDDVPALVAEVRRLRDAAELAAGTIAALRERLAEVERDRDAARRECAEAIRALPLPGDDGGAP